MTKNIVLALRQLGLTENETKVYIAGLKMGTAAASGLSRETGLGRPLVYHILKGLQEKGLVSTVGKKHSQQFVMEPPEKLRFILERKKQELDVVGEQLQKATIELQSLVAPTAYEQKVMFYEGWESLKNVTAQILRAKEKTVCGFIATDEMFSSLNETFIRYWSKERAKQNITSRTIWSHDTPPNYLEKLQEWRLAPEGTKIDKTIIIYDNTTLTLTGGKEPTALVIVDSRLTSTLRDLFELTWKRSIQISKN